jgi:uncharacterized membrane protein
MTNPKSTANIAGHPLHPMLVSFPIAFFVTTFVCDLAFWLTGVSFWASASLWLLGVGLIIAALAAVVGLIDFLGEPRIRALNDAWWHAGGNVLAVLIELYNSARWPSFLSGSRSRSSSSASCFSPAGKGWKLVNLHRVGVTDSIRSADAPMSRAAQR